MLLAGGQLAAGRKEFYRLPINKFICSGQKRASLYTAVWPGIAMQINNTAYKRIYLVGMMGSGKSHWASRLGQLFGLPYYDLDKLLEDNEAMPVRDIFQQKGEDYFRRAESAMLKSQLPSQHYILATGGGAPCFFDNLLYMKANGLVVWLNPAVHVLVERIQKSPGTRPILANATSNESLAAKLEQLLALRRPWYQQADIIISQNQVSTAAFERLIRPYMDGDSAAGAPPCGTE